MNTPVLANIAVLLTMAAIADADPASDQLIKFKNKTNGPVGILTYCNGAPIEMNEVSSLYTPHLLENEYFMDGMNRKIMQAIPERAVHAKGGGAFGYFKVTHNVTDVCKASLFESIGKETPAVVRFSRGTSDKGEPDTSFDVRGFGVKFYTESGNFDIAGINTPMFMLKDPKAFLYLSNVFKRNPVTNMKDQNMMWDFVASKPESINFILYLFGDNAIPDGYIHMPGYSIHFFQLYNKFGESYFGNFFFEPNAGIKNLIPEEGTKIGCSDPDYYNRVLYNSIENGNFPSWTLKLQLLSLDDVKNCKSNPFDPTKTLPLEKYPYREVGQLVLNSNPTNYFADVEQLAISPSNLVDGVMEAPDLIFKARKYTYKAAQRYRLGVNFHNIKVNQPLNKEVTYSRDGRAPVRSNGGDAPNYYPNSFNGPEPYVDKIKPQLFRIEKNYDSSNFEEATERYNKLSSDERQRLVGNLAASLSMAYGSVQERVIDLFKRVHQDLALRIAAALAETSKQ